MPLDYRPGSDYFNERYYMRGGLYEDKIFEFRKRAAWVVKTFNPKKALEIGSGEGCLLEAMRALNVDITGIDLSRYGSYFFKWGRVMGSDVQLPFRDGVFDLVCGFDILEHNLEADMPALMAELARVATGKGYFNVALEGQTTDEEKVDPTHFTLKPRSWWKKQFEPHFRVVGTGDCTGLRFEDAQFTVEKRVI